MRLSFPMNIGDGSKHRLDHRRCISLPVAVLFLYLVKKLLTLVHRLHHNPVVGALTIVDFLLKEVERLDDVIVHKLL